MLAGHARMNPSRAGLILRFDGASADTDRSQISSLCAHFGEVAYVDFRFGETMGFVRFRKPEAANAPSRVRQPSRLSRHTFSRPTQHAGWQRQGTLDAISPAHASKVSA